jgi:predicted DNA-binding ribbon-helix-helix protein
MDLASRRQAVYIHCMTRTQLYLDDEVHERLKALAKRQGCTVSDLVREAIARTYGGGNLAELRRTREAVRGLWADRNDLGSTEDYVRGLRRPARPRP